MTAPTPLPRNGPSLRVARFTVENFRAITTPVEMSFGDEARSGDPIVVLHGRNGTGKSTALLALAFGLDLLRDGYGSKTGLRERADYFSADAQRTRLGRRGITPRDRPSDPSRPLRLTLEFSDRRLGTYVLTVTPHGDQVKVDARVTNRRATNDPSQLRQWISTPYGPESHTFDALDSRRYASWVRAADTGSLVQPDLAERLFALRTSREPRHREAWRFFTEVLQRFEPFQGKLISIDRIQKDAAPELTFEDRGQLILGLDELSSGEQQVVAMVAAALLSEAAILAIEEPELNLDATNQGILRGIFADLVTRGFKDQIFLESHVAAFDGPGVLRFERDDTVKVTRAPTAAADAEKARQSGARSRWVSRDGYTRLPDEMVSDLRLGGGGPLWFLRGEQAWEAWREDELARHLGDDEEPTDG